MSGSFSGNVHYPLLKPVKGKITGRIKALHEITRAMLFCIKKTTKALRGLIEIDR